MPAIADRPPSIEEKRHEFDDSCLYRAFQSYTYLRPDIVYYGGGINLNSLESDNKFINLSKRIAGEYEALIDLYGEIDKGDLLTISDETISALLGLSPDNISAELTYHNSLMVTFRKDENLFFFERFFSPEDEEEVIFSLYEGSTKKPSFSGTFQEALTRLNMEIEMNSYQLFTSYFR